MSFRWDNYVLTTARTAGSAAVDTVIVSVIVIINIIIIIIIIIIVRKVTETRLTCLHSVGWLPPNSDHVMI